jgi:hypothetical protein
MQILRRLRVLNVYIHREGRRFESNPAKRSRLEVEIRKLLHEGGRIAEQALVRARRLKEEGQPAVEGAASGAA